MEEWKESIILPIYKKGDKTDSSNYTGISFLPTTYKILSNILLSSSLNLLTPTHAQLNLIKNHLKNFYMFRSTTIFRELQYPC